MAGGLRLGVVSGAPRCNRCDLWGWGFSKRRGRAGHGIPRRLHAVGDSMACVDSGGDGNQQSNPAMVTHSMPARLRPIQHFSMVTGQESDQQWH